MLIKARELIYDVINEGETVPREGDEAYLNTKYIICVANKGYGQYVASTLNGRWIIENSEFQRWIVKENE